MTQKIIKIITISLAAIFAFSMITITPTNAEAPWNDTEPYNDWYPNMNIPGSNEDIEMYVTYGEESYFDIEINISGSETNYDIKDDTYLGWCFQKNVMMTRNQWHNITMYHSYDPDKPDKYKNAQWDIINYIINNKGDATPDEIQEAIWYFMEGFEPTIAGVQPLIIRAENYGCNFCPNPGQKIAVIVNLSDSVKDPDYPAVQRAFIEVELKFYEGESASWWVDNPEYWDCYPCGCNNCDEYTDPETKIHEIFDISQSSSYGDKTLLETLQGNSYIPLPVQVMLREAVAGLLNSCHHNISYPLNCAQIITGVNDVYTNSNGYGMLRLYVILYFYNHLGINP